MKKQKFFSLILAFLLCLLTTNFSNLWAVSEEEEMRSTLPSDPGYHGQAPKREKKNKTVEKSIEETKAPQKNRKAKKVSAAEGEEWQTMHSEFSYVGKKKDVAEFSLSADQKKLAVEKIKFYRDKDQPYASSVVTLKKLGQFLSKKRQDISLRIEVHTDSVGSDQQNLDLSQKRADAVKKVLIDEGVAESRVEAVGRGDQDPIASDRTPDGQEKNRRVDFLVTSAGEAQPSAMPETTKPEETAKPVEAPVETPEPAVRTETPVVETPPQAPTTLPVTPPAPVTPPPAAVTPPPTVPATPPVPPSVMSTTPPTSLTPTLPATPPVAAPPVAAPPTTVAPAPAPTTQPSH